MSYAGRKKPEHLSRHPLIVLVVATALGSILIPVGTAFFSSQRAKERARQDIVTRILEYDSSTRQALLSLHTRVNVFDEQLRVLSLDSTALQTERTKLVWAALTDYLEFDRNLWTIPQQILSELRVRKLASECTIGKVDTDFDKYQKYAWTARNAIYDMWTACVNKANTPGAEEILCLHDNADYAWGVMRHEGSAIIVHAAGLIEEKVK